MAEKEEDIKLLEHRLKTMQQIYPQITAAQAVKIDKEMVAAVDELMTGVYNRGIKAAPNLGISDEVITSLILMYLKSNVDHIFDRAFGK